MDINTERDLNPEFMVHRIEDLNWHLLGGADDDEEIQHILFGFNNTIATHAPVVRREIVEERLKNAIDSSNTKAEAIDKYFDAASQVKSDSQNVHDSKVNNDLRDTLRRLKSTA
jgi:hypothetical protein